MPDRVIRERARKSEKLSALTAEAERLFWRLLTIADDHGRMRDNPVLILAEALPLLSDRISVEAVEGWLSELDAVKVIKRYMATDGQAVIWLRGWDVHQDIAFPNPSEFPGPPAERSPGKPGKVFAIQGRKHIPQDKGSPGSRVRDARHAPVSRAPYPSRIPGITSNSMSGTPDSGSPLLPGFESNSVPGTSGKGEGVRGRGTKMSRRRDISALPDPPEILIGFDTILHGLGDRYVPTENFYARISKLVAEVPGIDLEYEAESMVSWLTTNPKGKGRTDIPRFVDRWLDKTAEDVTAKRQRGARTGYNGNGGTQRAASGRPYGMGGPTLPETRESARKMDAEARRYSD